MNNDEWRLIQAKIRETHDALSIAVRASRAARVAEEVAWGVYTAALGTAKENSSQKKWEEALEGCQRVEEEQFVIIDQLKILDDKMRRLRLG